MAKSEPSTARQNGEENEIDGEKEGRRKETRGEEDFRRKTMGEARWKRRRKQMNRQRQTDEKKERAAVRWQLPKTNHGSASQYRRLIDGGSFPFPYNLASAARHLL